MSTSVVELPETFAHDQRELALSWLKFTLEHFQANLKRLKIGATHELEKSFQGTLVSAAGGDELKLRLAYAIQGMYVDMGVGRGMGAGVSKNERDYNELRNSRGQLLRHERRAKRWYARQMAFDGKRLAELVSDLYGQTMITSVSTAAPAQPVQVNF